MQISSGRAAPQRCRAVWSADTRRAVRLLSKTYKTRRTALAKQVELKRELADIEFEGGVRDETFEFFRLFAAEEPRATDLFEYRRAALLKQVADAARDCEYLDATARTIEFRLDNVAYSTLARAQVFLGDYGLYVAAVVFLSAYVFALGQK